MTRLPHPIPYQGSKRKLAPVIDRYLPESMETFYEPFAGSAAMTIYAAYYQRAEHFILADSLQSMMDLLRSIVENPEWTATRYHEIWEGQQKDSHGFFNEVRNRYNEERDPVDLLYLICRCVKNSVRFSGGGRFTQSVDKRRLGMHPHKMQAARAPGDVHDTVQDTGQVFTGVRRRHEGNEAAHRVEADPAEVAVPVDGDELGDGAGGAPRS